jgi:hypothetical protein
MSRLDSVDRWTSRHRLALGRGGIASGLVGIVVAALSGSQVLDGLGLALALVGLLSFMAAARHGTSGGSGGPDATGFGID